MLGQRNEAVLPVDAHEVNEAFDVQLPQSEHRSLNGFILEELGYVEESAD